MEMETVCFRDSKSLKRCRKWVAAPWQLFFPTCPHGQSLAAKPHRICSHSQVEMASWRAIGYLQLGTGAFAQLCRSSSALCGYPQGKYIIHIFKYIQIYPRIAMQQGGLKNPPDIPWHQAAGFTANLISMGGVDSSPRTRRFRKIPTGPTSVRRWSKGERRKSRKEHGKEVQRKERRDS